MSAHPTLLLIDDQWGGVDHPMWPARFGQLPYRVLRETAQERTGRYSVRAAVRRVEQEATRLRGVLLDIAFGPEDGELGIEILAALRARYPALPIIMFTHFESSEHRELLIRCLELGANDYISKATTAPRLQQTLELYLDSAKDETILGQSEGIRRLRAQVARVAFSGNTPVLIVGESGAGKELVARAIHRNGPRRNGPFVDVNSANADSHIIESDLFGHERGAFTGAERERAGAIERANGGVLFLDELADMPKEVQGKLLRALETRSFRRLGGNETIASQFQLVCATNRAPSDLLREGKLREDFYHRIATMLLHVPPLRERREDVPMLANRLLQKCARAVYPPGREPKLTKADLRLLETHRWPGNVRELWNVIQRSVLIAPTGQLDIKGALAVTSELGPLQANTEALSAKTAPTWVQQRLRAEMEIALTAKENIQRVKGRQWKAEFMRQVYPSSKVPSARGFADLIKRLSSGPWGDPQIENDSVLADLLRRLRE